MDEKTTGTTVADAVLNTAGLVKQMMKVHGMSFAQAWTILKDGMDRQQHFADNQVALLLGGFQDVREDEPIPDDDLVTEAMDDINQEVLN